jgi:hypothetical protein
MINRTTKVERHQTDEMGVWNVFVLYQEKKFKRKVRINRRFLRGGSLIGSLSSNLGQRSLREVSVCVIKIAPLVTTYDLGGEI